MAELKACPFCGGSDVTLIVSRTSSAEYPTQYIACSFCGARGPHYAVTVPSAKPIGDWNRRATVRGEGGA